MLGIDDAEMGEFAYDYVGLEKSVDTVGAVGGSREPDHLHHHQKDQLEGDRIPEKDQVTEVEVLEGSVDGRSEKVA